jgi:sodium-dependent dicarboxylate transporter 2/3/5
MGMEYAEEQQVLTPTSPLQILFSFKSVVLISVVALFAYLVNYLPFESSVNQGFAILAAVAILWFTAVIPLSVTALLIPIAAVYMGIFDTKTAMASFSHPVIYLFFSGFVIAAAINSQGIDKFLAEKLLVFSDGHLGKALVLLFSVTAFFSMWISNIATTTIMLPLVIGLLSQIDDQKNRSTYVFALLGIAYSANIGGLGTIVGCAPNAISASYVGITFFEWMKFGIPTVLIMMPIMILSLYFMLKPDLSVRCKVKQGETHLTTQGKMTIAIFIATALCWLNSANLSAMLGGVKYLDSVIGLSAAVALVVFGLVDWNKAQRNTDWGVLILFGGGITLSQVLKVTGTSAFFANEMAGFLSTVNPIAFVLVIIVFVIALTQFTSNTASATLLVPIFVTLSEAFGLSPMVISAVVGMAASFAFMLPVATPPNAIVFGTGYIDQRQMVRVGMFVNVAGIAVLFGIASIML